ncbi:MAG: hypothetical protein JJT89_01980 [Nitriliruptoraceae bacterium]|nr:hypothetical protein [Nitriliruptoraceae bacterium]
MAAVDIDAPAARRVSRALRRAGDVASSATPTAYAGATIGPVTATIEALIARERAVATDLQDVLGTAAASLDERVAQVLAVDR